MMGMMSGMRNRVWGDGGMREWEEWRIMTILSRVRRG